MKCSILRRLALASNWFERAIPWFVRRQRSLDRERGRRNPTVITLYELAQALRVSHVELVEPDDDKT
jgi:transcriptional regulator with XRE-family HTH domain